MLNLLRNDPKSILLGNSKLKFGYECQVACSLGLLFHQSAHYDSPSLPDFPSLIQKVASKQPEIREFIGKNPEFITLIKWDGEKIITEHNGSINMDIFIAAYWLLRSNDSNDLYTRKSV